MIKKCCVFFILCLNSVFSYKFNLFNKNLFNKNNKLITRRKLNTLSPFIITYLANNDKSIDELRSEANRIIEIIEAQKKSFSDLPEINKGQNNNQINNENSNTMVIKEIDNILNDLLITFKNSEPDVSISKLKSYCSDANAIKYKKNKDLINIFNDSKYGILFKKFKSFEIINYNSFNEDDTDFCDVDVKISASYKDLLYNGIQFNDIHYGDNTNLNLNNNENICYIIYRWNFIKKNKYELLSCYLVSKDY